MTRAALFFVLASILMAGPHVWPPTRLSDFPYDFTDDYIFLWNFWWTKKAVTDFVNPFYTDYLFYPIYCSRSVPIFASLERGKRIGLCPITSFTTRYHPFGDPATRHDSFPC
jgi:hypothetical protein